MTGEGEETRKGVEPAKSRRRTVAVNDLLELQNVSCSDQNPTARRSDDELMQSLKRARWQCGTDSVRRYRSVLNIKMRDEGAAVTNHMALTSMKKLTLLTGYTVRASGEQDLIRV